MYCACVNNQLSCPKLTSSACSNNSTTIAYVPSSWYEKGPDNSLSMEDICTTTPICEIVNIITGNNDEITKDVQGCNNKLAAPPTTNTIIASITSLITGAPTLFICVAILVLAIVAGLLSGRSGSESKGALPPPPPPDMFDTADT